MDQPRTCVTFKSEAFNTTEVKDYFINPCCFGDDLAEWLMEELESRDVEVVGEPGQEDFGWYFTFSCDGADYDFVMGWREGDEDWKGDWFGCIERRVGILSTLLGGRKRNIDSSASRAIHAVLVDSEKVEDVRWYFDKGSLDGDGDEAEEPT